MRITTIFLLSAVLSTSFAAQDIKIVGTIDQVVNAPQDKTLSNKTEKKHIKLLKIELSDNGIAVIKKRAKNLPNSTKRAVFKSKLPSKVALGMNNVPVLDQGQVGSCVTFATTTAINAILNKGDYVSQLCQLQLGSYLEKNGFVPSGWDGTSARLTLSQIEHFGIINKEKERTHGCGGLTAYPMDKNPTPESAMSPEEFHQLSENLESKDFALTWSPLLDPYQAVLERTDTNQILDDIKTALNEQDRVTVGVMLFDMDQGFMGAVGTHKSKYDTWVMTTELSRDLYLRPNFGGHEMVITGYDDEAITIDDQGRQYKGLLTLRNSWSEKYGDKGDFYMTYDYFRILVMEAQRIRNLSDYINSEDSNDSNVG